MSENIYLRPATLDDAKLFFDWVNEPAVRKNSFNTNDIAWEEHLLWFQGALVNRDVRIFVMMNEDVPIGQIRLTLGDGFWEIDYSIDVRCRGRGYGSKILSLVEAELERDMKLRAEVKYSNLPSQKAFEKQGYNRQDSGEGFYLYEKDILPKVVVVSNKEWHRHYIAEIEARTNVQIIYLNSRADVTSENLQRIKPDWVFFPHWSYIIPADIYENFRCVIFHMTDLPFGRGGSPLQNLIARGIYETKLSAIRCVKDLDAGEIYKKVPLSLWGTAEEIYLRAAELTKELMVELILHIPEPIPQEGNVVTFKRRKPEDGNIASCDNLQKLFDYIRMLDADGYPAAFLETDRLRLEFSRASLKADSILADVKISMKEV